MSSGSDKDRRRLSTYLDGELPEPEARQLAEDLRNDPQLADELTGLRAVRDLLRNLPPARAPAGLAERVLERAERARLVAGAAETRPARTATYWLYRLATAAVVLVAVGVGVAVVASLRTRSFLEENAPLARQPAEVPPEGELAFQDWKENGDLRGETGVMRKRVAEAPVAGLHAGRAAILEAGRPGMVTNLVINTAAADLPVTQSQIEGVLSRNYIVPAEAMAAVPMRDKVRARANFYAQSRSGPRQIRYRVVATEAQLRKIFDEVNQIRRRQKVAQLPVTGGPDAAAGELAMTDGLADRPAGGGRRAGRPAKAAAKGRYYSGQRLRRPAESVARGAPRKDGAPGEAEFNDASGRRKLARADRKGDADRLRMWLEEDVAATFGAGKPPHSVPVPPPARAAARPYFDQAVPTTRPAAAPAGPGVTAFAMCQRSRSEAPPGSLQAATMMTAKVRELVIILNGVQVSGRSAVRVRE